MKNQYIKQFESEGFKHIYEWSDKPGEEYQSHKHQDKVSLYIVSGSICFNIAGKHFELNEGDRLDVPPLTEHTAKVGEYGCTMIVGEMIKGDS